MENKDLKECPYCKRLIERDNRICPKCFKELPLDFGDPNSEIVNEVNIDVPEVDTPSPVIEDDLKVNEETNDVSSTPSTTICSSCGYEMSNKDAYCYKCGTPNPNFGRNVESVKSSASDANRNPADMLLLNIGLGIFFAILIPLVGIVLNILSIIKVTKYYQNQMISNSQRVKYLILSIVGLVLCVIIQIFMVIQVATDPNLFPQEPQA